MRNPAGMLRSDVSMSSFSIAAGQREKLHSKRHTVEFDVHPENVRTEPAII